MRIKLHSNVRKCGKVCFIKPLNAVHKFKFENLFKMSKFTVKITLLLALFAAGCVETEKQNNGKSIGSEVSMSGGYTDAETFVTYEYSETVWRRGKIVQTGDTYSYANKARNIEISPVVVPFVPDPSFIRAPKRANVLGGCNKDAISDAVTCHLNLMPQGAVKGGGLIQHVDLNGNIQRSCVLGHDYPGQTAAIRVDNNRSFISDENGCVRGSSARSLQAQLLTGTSVTTRRIEWPYLTNRDKEMLIDGSFSRGLELYRWTASADLEKLFSMQN